MTPSARIATFIKAFEKLRLEAYLPNPNDRPTIGYGETNGITLGMVWTREQAEANFASRLTRLGAAVWPLVRAAPRTTQGQFDAMVSLADNIGLAGFTGSSVRTNHLAGHHATAALAFSLWNKQRNVRTRRLEPVAGLTRRRADEAAIYRGEGTAP